MAKKEYSEFGKGFTYCLANFLAHEMRINEFMGEEIKFEKKTGKKFEAMNIYEMWFNGAADHLIEFNASDAPEKYRSRAIDFKDKCIKWRLTFGQDKKPTKEDFEWAVKEARELLMVVDREVLKTKVVKGEWE